MSKSVANTVWARAFVDELARAGLRDVIIAPGSRSTPIVMACAADSRLRCRVHLDERSAAFFALGVGKATGAPAAVVTTSGTAVANCLPAVVEASEAGVPLLVLTADRPPRLHGADANQAIDQTNIYGGFVREAFDPGLPSLDEPSLRNLRAVAGRAMAAAMHADAGPVHVNLPFEKPLEPAPDAELPDPVVELSAQLERPDGQPYSRIDVAPARLDEDAVGALVERLAGRRGVIVAGPTEQARTVGPAIRRFAAATGFPLLADPLSGARYGPPEGARLVAAYDLLLGGAETIEGLSPELVVRVGASPTSAALQRWLERHAAVESVLIDASPRWKDHGATVSTYLRADPLDTLDRLTSALGAAPTDGAWQALWGRAEHAALSAIDDLKADGSLHEGDIAAAVLAAVPDGGVLFVSSSMPIRDLDAFGHPRPERVHVYANRGASGIDGVVSSAFGVASRYDGTALCLIGDIAFFHDQNGLLWSREFDATVVFVVIDNDGGGIFHMLPIAGHEPDFTRFFATPHGLDPRHAAAAHGLDYAEVEPGDVEAEVRRRLDRGRTAVLRVRTERIENHARHVAVRRAVVDRVRAELG